MTAVAIFTGGAPPTARSLDALTRPDVVIAADSGLHHVPDRLRPVDIVIGDFDSARSDAVAIAAEAGAVIDRHPADKDATDLELALAHAIANGATSITVVGGGGPDRVDHFLANALVLGSDAWGAASIRWLIEDAVGYIVRTRLEVSGEPGDLVSLLPIHGDAEGVSASGVRWPLDDADLPAGTTRGVSNELTETTATIEVRTGVLLVVHTKGQT